MQNKFLYTSFTLFVQSAYRATSYGKTTALQTTTYKRSSLSLMTRLQNAIECGFILWYCEFPK